MTTPPANWYPDPQQPTQLRYWDGAQWTEHVAPALQAAPAPAAAPKQKMSGGAVAAIVVGSALLVLVVIGILAAIAIPVFLNQREKEADAEAKASLRDLATTISTGAVDHPGELPVASAFGPAVTLVYADGTASMVALQPRTSFGGLVGSDPDHWCVWVSSPNGSHEEWQYSTWGEFEAGHCTP